MATIRKMTLKDIDVIYDLECQLFGASAWPKETLKKDMELFYFDVLEENDEIVGYCSLSVLYENADILNIGVHPNHRRKGYGTMLMKHMLDMASREKVENITLEVRVSNQPAIALYESLGFKKAAKRRQYYQDGEDAFLMIYEKEAKI